ncbi:MAG: MFS transporter [Coriobacteriia bacterium]|nr:MFS transporter [Coriobacteriia bacterium]
MMKNRFQGLNRREKALFSSSFFHGLGVETAYFVGITGYAAYNLNAGPALIATVMLCVNFAQIIGSFVAGSLVDKFGPRKVVIAAAGLTVAVSLSSMFIGEKIVLFMAFAAALGALLSTSKTAYNAYAPYVEEGREGLKKINALVLLGSYISAIFGPLIGGFIVGKFPTMTVFLFAAVAVVVSLMCAIIATEQHKPEVVRDKSHPLREATEGMRLIFSEPALRYFLVVGIILWFSFGAFDALESLYYKDVVGAGIQWMGWINAMIGVGLVVGVLVLSRIPARRINSVLLAVFVGLVGAGSILYVATRSVYAVMAGGFILGVAFGVAEPMMRTLVQATAPLESVGRVLGSLQTIRIGFALIPLALSPFLAKLLGVQGVLLGASILTVALSICLIPLARRVDITAGVAIPGDRIDPLAEGEDIAPHDRAPIGQE